MGFPKAGIWNMHILLTWLGLKLIICSPGKSDRWSCLGWKYKLLLDLYFKDFHIIQNYKFYITVERHSCIYLHCHISGSFQNATLYKLKINGMGKAMKVAGQIWHQERNEMWVPLIFCYFTEIGFYEYLGDSPDISEQRSGIPPLP
jgi:hypothetical protein